MVVASWSDGRAAHDAHCANDVCVRVAVVAPAHVRWPRLLVLILGSPQIEEGRVGPWDSPRDGPRPVAPEDAARLRSGAAFLWCQRVRTLHRDAWDARGGRAAQLTVPEGR